MKTTDFINVYTKESNETDPFVANLQKLDRVIDSCKTLDQLRSAKEYAQLMYKKLGSAIAQDQGFGGLEDVLKLYNQIFQKIKDKEAQLDMPVFEAADAEREFQKLLGEDATGGATASGSVAVAVGGLGNGTQSIIKRQQGYTNQRTKGGTVKAKK